MTDAEHAVREAAADIPAEVCARFDTADKLSDEDRKTIIEIARQALALFNPSRKRKRAPKPNQSQTRSQTQVCARAGCPSDTKPKPETEAKEKP